MVFHSIRRAVLVLATNACWCAACLADDPFTEIRDKSGTKVFVVPGKAETFDVDLLPKAPKSYPKLSSWSDFAEVPEVGLEEPLRAHSRGEAMNQVAFRFALINTLNRKRTDGFLYALLERRPDLAGLPFRMGDDCWLSNEEADGLAEAAAATADRPHGNACRSCLRLRRDADLRNGGIAVEDGGSDRSCFGADGDLGPRAAGLVFAGREGPASRGGGSQGPPDRRLYGGPSRRVPLSPADRCAAGGGSPRPASAERSRRTTDRSPRVRRSATCPVAVERRIPGARACSDQPSPKLSALPCAAQSADDDRGRGRCGEGRHRLDGPESLGSGEGVAWARHGGAPAGTAVPGPRRRAPEQLLPRGIVAGRRDRRLRARCDPISARISRRSCRSRIPRRGPTASVSISSSAPGP